MAFRACPYASSASAWRPAPSRARISSSHRPSRSGWSARSLRSSGTTWAWPPQASSAVIRSSAASRRSSASRSASASTSGVGGTSASGLPCHSASASASWPAAPSGVAGRERPPAVADHGLEHLGVGVRRAQAELVAGSAGDQEGAVRVVQEPAQPEHVDADEVGRLGGRRVPPHLVDQHVGGDDLPSVDQQGRQDGTPLRRTDPLPVFSGPDLKRSEQPEPHHYPGSLASG